MATGAVLAGAGSRSVMVGAVIVPVVRSLNQIVLVPGVHPGWALALISARLVKPPGSPSESRPSMAAMAALVPKLLSLISSHIAQP